MNIYLLKVPTLIFLLNTKTKYYSVRVKWFRCPSTDMSI